MPNRHLVIFHTVAHLERDTGFRLLCVDTAFPMLSLCRMNGDCRDWIVYSRIKIRINRGRTLSTSDRTEASPHIELPPFYGRPPYPRTSDYNVPKGHRHLFQRLACEDIWYDPGFLPTPCRN